MVDFYRERAVRWDDGSVVLIDQTKLPQRFTHVECRDHLQIADAIRRMVVRGAPAIGVAAAMGLALIARNSKSTDRERLLLDLERGAEVLGSTRPTAVNLPWALQRVLARAGATQGGAEEVRSAVEDEARRMAEEDVHANRTMGRLGSGLLEDGDAVLTHCSTGTLATVGYGTAVGVIRAAKEAGKCVHVIATETRPALQGARLNAFELREDGFNVTVIADTAVGSVMSRGMVNKAITGADRICLSGHVFNKIGTYQVAVLSERHHIPFFVAAPSSTFDLKTQWSDVIIEERGVEEVVKIRGDA